MAERDEPTSSSDEERNVLSDRARATTGLFASYVGPEGIEPSTEGLHRRVRIRTESRWTGKVAVTTVFAWLGSVGSACCRTTPLSRVLGRHPDPKCGGIRIGVPSRLRRNVLTRRDVLANATLRYALARPNSRRTDADQDGEARLGSLLCRVSSHTYCKTMSRSHAGHRVTARLREDVRLYRLYPGRSKLGVHGRSSRWRFLLTEWKTTRKRARGST
jgi:hypothetical protein